MDEDGFIHRQNITSGNVHDSQERDMLLLGDGSALYADAAYSSEQTREKLKRFNIDDQVQRKGYRGHSISQSDKGRNAVFRSLVQEASAPLQHTNDTMDWRELDSWGWLKMPPPMVSLQWL